MAVFLLLLSCAPVNTTDPEIELFHETDPVLEAVDYECNSSDGSWTFRVQTTGWTGGGRLYIAQSNESVEQHKIVSAEAAASGDWDCLIEELDIAEDWTLAQSGTSTRWLCSDEPELSFMVQIYDARADAVADCAAWGAKPELWSTVEGLEPCTEFLQPESQTTDTGSIRWRGECDG